MTFPNAGVYTVTFTVTDAIGLRRSDAGDPDDHGSGSRPREHADSADGLERALRRQRGDRTAGYLAANAFDGNPNTRGPHSGSGAGHSARRMRFRSTWAPPTTWRASAICPISRGSPDASADYEFYVSADGVNWGTPVAVGAFPGSQFGGGQGCDVSAEDGAVRAIPRADGTARPLSHLPRRVERVARRDGHATRRPPRAWFRPPRTSTSASEARSASKGSASDPDGHLPLTYRWSVGTGSGVPDLTVVESGRGALRSCRNVPGHLDGDRRARSVRRRRPAR